MEVVIAYFLDLLIGDPQGYPHPVRIIGSLIKESENIVFKHFKSEYGLKIMGYIMTAFIVSFVFLFNYYLVLFSGFINLYLKFVVNVLLIYTTIAAKDLAKASWNVYEPLINGQLKDARKNLSFIVSRDTEMLDYEDIARGTIETISENISDGIIAPLLYAFIGGAPLAMAYKAASTLDSMVGYKNEKYKYFGYASAKLDDILNFIPSRLTGVLIVLSSFLLGYDYKNSWRIFKRDRLKHESPNSAHGEAAVAGALNIQLGGLNYYFKKPEIKPTLGDKKQRIKPFHIQQSIKIMYVTSFLGVMIFYILKILFVHFII